jgi:pyrroloquinoline quinone biosynthesis protein B
MHVRVLGAAAGGGFPQWNCLCSNCQRLRQGRFQGSARSQTQLAINGGSEGWFLINASPDLRYQIESFPLLHPHSESLRQSPIKGVVLTSAEVDAALGLLLLRESQPLVVYATEAVRTLLMEYNNIFGVLRRQPDQVRWRTIVPGTPFELQGNCSTVSIRCTALSTGGRFPGHVPLDTARDLDPAEAIIGLFLEQGSGRIGFFPGIHAISPELLEKLEQCDAILFDGTFWSDSELIRIQGEAKTAREMGHLPVGDSKGTLEELATLVRPRKIFIHINNTNPMLDEDSPEYARVRASGWEMAFDGMGLST